MYIDTDRTTHCVKYVLIKNNKQSTKQTKTTRKQSKTKKQTNYINNLNEGLQNCTIMRSLSTQNENGLKFWKKGLFMTIILYVS